MVGLGEKVSPMDGGRHQRTQQLGAWLVHFYTAVGLVLAAGMAVLIARGGDDAFRWAFVLMVAATAIDSTDGWLARKARVKEVLPGFNGRTLDDLTDFHTYTSMPLFLIWRAQILPAGLSWVLLLPLLASAYGFSQSNAKTADGFFLGFPSYWNVVAFYLYMLEPPVWISLAVLVGFAVLTLVPARYLYISSGGPFAKVMLAAGALWAGLAFLLLVRPPAERKMLAGISLFYPLAYLTLSWLVTMRRSSTLKSHVSTPKSDHSS
jgi:phosphatidylcholine synthase